MQMVVEGKYQIRTLKINDQTMSVLASNQWNL